MSGLSLPFYQENNKNIKIDFKQKMNNHIHSGDRYIHFHTHTHNFKKIFVKNGCIRIFCNSSFLTLILIIKNKTKQ